MRFMTLTEMLTELRGETGISQNVAHGVASLEPQKALIRRVQEDLYLAHDWPHLRTEKIKTVPAGDRYAEIPTTFDPTGIESVWTKSSTGKWVPVAYGIGPIEYNLYSSDDGDQNFPVQRWATYYQSEDDVSTNMFEVWPIPNEDAQIMFRGRRALLPLDADDKTSTLDGPLIVLFAAAEILARQKAEDAGLKLQKALDRLRWLEKRYGNKDNRMANLAGGTPQRQLRPGIDYMTRR